MSVTSEDSASAAALRPFTVETRGGDRGASCPPHSDALAPQGAIGAYIQWLT